MPTPMQKIKDLINKGILQCVKKVHEEFPEIPISGMLAIWCKQQNI